MRSFLVLIFLLPTLVFSFDLQSEGVEITYENDEGEEKSLVIKREKPSECLNVDFTPKMVLGGDFANSKVPQNCKKSFVTAFGKISPIKFSDKIDTYGELEVLEFIEKAKDDENMLLIDSRTEEWFIHSTIPTAVNVPYIYLKESQYPDEFKEMLELLGVEETKNGYDFSNAKELLMFCNAAWCGQSPVSMKRLIKLGYPQEKMNWYRGGIQSWLSLNLPVIQPN